MVNSFVNACTPAYHAKILTSRTYFSMVALLFSSSCNFSAYRTINSVVICFVAMTFSLSAPLIAVLGCSFIIAVLQSSGTGLTRNEKCFRCQMASPFTKQESREARLSPDFLDEWSTLYKPLYRHNNKSGVSISPAAGRQRQQLLRIARSDFCVI